MKGKGLKIHQTKAGCLKKVEEHRKASKSEATQVPDKNHSDREGHVNRDHEASKMENLHSPNLREGRRRKKSQAKKKEEDKTEEKALRRGRSPSFKKTGGETVLGMGNKRGNQGSKISESY